MPAAQAIMLSITGGGVNVCPSARRPADPRSAQNASPSGSSPARIRSRTTASARVLAGPRPAPRAARSRSAADQPATPAAPSRTARSTSARSSGMRSSGMRPSAVARPYLPVRYAPVRCRPVRYLPSRYAPVRYGPPQAGTGQARLCSAGILAARENAGHPHHCDVARPPGPRIPPRGAADPPAAVPRQALDPGRRRHPGWAWRPARLAVPRRAALRHTGGASPVRAGRGGSLRRPASPGGGLAPKYWESAAEPPGRGAGGPHSGPSGISQIQGVVKRARTAGGKSDPIHRAGWVFPYVFRVKG